MGINTETAKKAETIARELSEKNGLPIELNLSEAYDILFNLKNNAKKTKP